MKYRNTILSLIIGGVVGLLLFNIRELSIYNENLITNIEKQNETIKELTSDKENIIKCNNELVETSITSTNEKLALIEPLKKYNKKEYLAKYKIIMANASDASESIYDVYDNDELLLFAKLVEAEATGGDFESKCNVASVVWNRLYGGDFGDTIETVIKWHNQFSPIIDGRINEVGVTCEDYLAIEYTFSIEDTTNGCISFDNVKGNSWSKKNLKYVFTDSVGHSFYKLKEEN